MPAKGRTSTARSALAVHAWPETPDAGHQEGLPHPYDPMAVATLPRPDLRTWRSGVVSVELADGDGRAVTRLAEASGGHHWLAWDVDRAAATEFYLQRLLAI